MFQNLLLAVCFLLFSRLATAQSIPYGNNPATGKFATVNGIQMYYEVYGQGEPMVLIHGNGSSIRDMSNQVSFFSKYFKVIVADSREHGKTTSDGQRLTYEKMTSDWVKLLDQLGIDSANIVGWSDGGIIGLLMAIHNPVKVKKLAAMGANLQPDSTAVYPWAVKWVKQNAKHANDQIKLGDTSKPYAKYSRLFDLLGNQPHISFNQLKNISAPVLVMSGDKDVIREEHTIKIFQEIPKAHLCIFPGATHMIPTEDPEIFNKTVFKFMTTPYSRPDTKSYFP